MTTGQIIRKIRKEKGYTQKQLAAKCGMATGTIQQYELGKREPRQEQLQKIAAVFGVSTDYLKTGKTIDELLTEMMQQSIVIGDDMRKIRKKRGLTLRQVADNLDCSPRLVSQYENGEVIIGSEMLDKIAIVLDATFGSELETGQTRLLPDEDIFEKGITISSHSYTNPNIVHEQSNELSLITDYRKLNDTGQTEARKRIKELTELPQYTKKAEQPPNNQD